MPSQKLVAQSCTHWWVLASPDGPTSSGRCKYCGVERHDFRNSLPYNRDPWERQEPPLLDGDTFSHDEHAAYRAKRQASRKRGAEARWAETQPDAVYY